MIDGFGSNLGEFERLTAEYLKEQKRGIELDKELRQLPFEFAKKEKERAEGLAKMQKENLERAKELKEEIQDSHQKKMKEIARQKKIAGFDEIESKIFKAVTLGDKASEIDQGMVNFQYLSPE